MIFQDHKCKDFYIFTLLFPTILDLGIQYSATSYQLHEVMLVGTNNLSELAVAMVVKALEQHGLYGFQMYTLHLCYTATDNGLNIDTDMQR
jgi:hypothetical protein